MAEAHILWTLEQWITIFWSDETWAIDGHNPRHWITRKIVTIRSNSKDPR